MKSSTFSYDDILNQIATDDLANQISSSWLYQIDAVSGPDLPAIRRAGAVLFSLLPEMTAVIRLGTLWNRWTAPTLRL